MVKRLDSSVSQSWGQTGEGIEFHSVFKRRAAKSKGFGASSTRDQSLSSGCHHDCNPDGSVSFLQVHLFRTVRQWSACHSSEFEPRTVQFPRLAPRWEYKANMGLCPVWVTEVVSGATWPFLALRVQLNRQNGLRGTLRLERVPLAWRVVLCWVMTGELRWEQVSVVGLHCLCGWLAVPHMVVVERSVL